MSKSEVRDELLSESLKSREVDLARSFLESCTTSTHALRCLMAVMCELDQLREAAVIESYLPAVATIEAESI